MIPDVLAAFLERPSDDSLRELLDSDFVFWVDWREEDQAIVGYCESVLQTGSLAARVVDAENDAGFELYIERNGIRTLVPLTVDPADRHITICTLNDVLAPNYEIRFCIASDGMDSLVFLPLASADWTTVETNYPDVCATHFAPITSAPNFFTEGYEKTNWRALANNPRQKIAAIKLYREQNDCSLAEAKTAVEAYIAQCRS